MLCKGLSLFSFTVWPKIYYINGSMAEQRQIHVRILALVLFIRSFFSFPIKWWESKLILLLSNIFQTSFFYGKKIVALTHTVFKLVQHDVMALLRLCFLLNVIYFIVINTFSLNFFFLEKTFLIVLYNIQLYNFVQEDKVFFNI